jgi:hypothetical protein
MSVRAFEHLSRVGLGSKLVVSIDSSLDFKGVDALTPVMFIFSTKPG